jgi:hypothetical protein
MVEAQQWWKAHQATFDFVPSTTMAEKTLVIEQTTRTAVFPKTTVSR